MRARDISRGSSGRGGATSAMMARAPKVAAAF